MIARTNKLCHSINRLGSVLGWQQWLEELASRYLPQLLILSDADKAIIWQQSCLNLELPSWQHNSLVHYASQAYALMLEYQIPDSALSHEPILQKCLSTFASYCQQKNLLPREAILTKLLNLFSTNPPSNSLPAAIELLGFDDITPVQQAWLDLLNKLGVQVESTRPNAKARKYTLSKTKNLQNAINEIANIFEQLQQQNSSQRYAIIIPELAKHRAEVKQALQLAFANQALPCSISAPLALASYPVIQHIQLLLTFLCDPSNTLNLLPLLRSPFYQASAMEQAEHISLLKTISELNLYQYHPRIDNKFTRFATSLSLPRRQAASDWANWLHDSLSALNWPGQHSHTADTAILAPCIEALTQILRDFNRYDRTLEPLSFKRFIQLLNKALEQPFSPDAGDKPISVLGPLECAGLHFDHAWLLNFTSNHWPKRSQPNPLLPIYLQRQHGIRDADPDKYYEYHQNISQRLSHIAQHVHFIVTEDEEDSTLSSLFSTLEITDQKPEANVRGQLSPQFEQFLDDKAPCYQENKIPGGAYSLQLQATCPFKAFAKTRLKADKPLKPQAMIPSTLRGQMLHKSLEIIWQQLQDADTLRSYPASQLEILLNEAISTACKLLSFQYLPFIKNEQQRLYKLLQQWLEFESKREDFSIYALEKSLNIDLGGHSIEVRIDRIDRLKDGKLFIIDYKSGQYQRILDWFCTPLITPQLPLYACFSKPKPSAIAYAEVKLGKINFKGVAEHGELVKGLKPIKKIVPGVEFSEQLMSWHHELEHLVKQFSQGDASLSPVEGACEFCDLQSLCRIYEHTE